MTLHAYLSNITPGWSIQQQKDVLAAHVPGWPDIPTYIDRLPPAKRKAHSPASLTQRAELLRGTWRPENVEGIVVVSLACLAWEQVDFLQCVAAATTRGATIVALDTGRRIAPGATPAEIADAAQEFARRRAAKGGMGRPGYLVSAEKRSAEAKAAAMRIKDRWELPTKDYPTDALLAEADICRNTANFYLGNRPEAQRLHRNHMAQAARNRKRRIGIEVQEQVA
jgi:hypothetical protein